MADGQTTALYCLADPLYYDVPDRLADADSRYRQATGPVPPGWRRGGSGLWNSLHPDGRELPGQGWKIHLAALPDDAAKILDTVADSCLRHRVTFKFLRSRRALLLASDKYMDRSAAGKFITVYPDGERELELLLGEFTEALDGLPGPYILSDLRIGPGPVHVRYGAFTAQWCAGPNGTPIPALRDPSGDLVPDHRGPVFHIPDWATVPAVLAPHLAARERPAGGDGAAGDAEDFPYLIREALHFTNAGGIYRAEHRDTGRPVVLREARPHSGLDGVGDDAVIRLHREHRALTRLAGLPQVPEQYGVHTVWEHHFLIEEYIPGWRLLDALVTRFPLVHADVTEADLAAHLAWVTDITDQLSRALDALHARGVSFGDMHPGNIMLRPDGSVALVDFEYAGEAGAVREAVAGAAGFAARGDLTGAEADRYALRAVWRTMLLPLAELTALDPDKTATVEAVIRERYRLPPDAGPAVPVPAVPAAIAPGGGEDRVRGLFGADGGEADWPALRALLIRGIHAGATPERADRLFPAGPEVAETGGHTLAHGAAGVLLALHHVGEPVPARYTDWLLAAARRAAPGHHRGLLDGLWGAAGVLHELGRTEDALDLVDRARTARPPGGVGLGGGTAGIALARLRFARITGDPALLSEAVRTAAELTALPDAADGELPPTAGLLPGLSGAALLQLRLYRVTGEARWLAAARRSLRWELGHCVATAGGLVQKKSGERHLVYLHEGSGGIALVAREYLETAGADADPELAEFVAGVTASCDPEFVREPGLFHGRAGLLAMLARLSAPDDAAPGDRAPDAPAGDRLAGQLRRMAWYPVSRAEGLLIPGGRLLRCSADLATGAAGVLLALHSALGAPGTSGDHRARGPLELLVPA
jgi:hypothetical protein